MKELLKNWEWKKLGELCLGKGQYGSGASKVYFDSKVRYIRITDIDDRGNLKDDEMVSPSTIEEDCFLEENDLLFARSGSVGRTYLHKKRDNLNYQYAGYLIRFKINSKIANPEFVYYLTKSPQYFNWVESIKKSGTISNINAREFASYELAIPPLEVPKQIITILERAEKLKNLRQEANDENNTIIQALFYEMFGNNKYPLEEIAKHVKKTDSRDPTEIPNDKFKYVDIAGIDNNIGVIKEAKEIIGKDAPSRARREIKVNDIIVSTVRPNLNATALVPKGLDNQICSTGFCVIRCDNTLNPKYLYTITRQRKFVNELIAKTKGASYPAVTNNDILKVKIPIPPISLQNQFASLVEKIESIKQNQTQSTEEINTLFDALMQKAFQGELIA